MTKYKAGNSGHKIDIEQGWRVLDIGSGHNPHIRANILMDKNLLENTERSGKPLRLYGGKTLIVGNAESMPFKNKKFNYIIASHIAEHVDNPTQFCMELMRVGERGYIESPSKFGEILLSEPFHKWFVYGQNGTLVFEKITRFPSLGVLGEIFYALFYSNTERVRYKTISFSNKYMRYISSKIVNYFIQKPWIKAKKITYTCFEWKDSFGIKVIQKKEN